MRREGMPVKAADVWFKRSTAVSAHPDCHLISIITIPRPELRLGYVVLSADGTRRRRSRE
jgi:hypothetical protein